MLIEGRAPAPGAPEVERELAFDMLKRGVWFAPLVLFGATMIWGVEGAASAALAIALVSVNLLLAAFGLSWAAKRSLNHLMVVSLAGFAVRMGLVTAVLFAARPIRQTHRERAGTNPCVVGEISQREGVASAPPATFIAAATTENLRHNRLCRIVVRGSRTGRQLSVGRRQGPGQRLEGYRDQARAARSRSSRQLVASRCGANGYVRSQGMAGAVGRPDARSSHCAGR